MHVIGHAEVEDRVHHPRQACRGAGADRHEQRPLAATECPPGDALQLAHRRRQLTQHLIVDRATGVVVAPALIGGEHKSRWHGDAVPEHLDDAPRLGAEQIATGVQLAGEGQHCHHCALPAAASSRRVRPASEMSSSCSSNHTV